MSGLPHSLQNLETNPLKCEYFLRFVVDELLREGKATAQVRKSMDKWYGVTYKEDKPNVVVAIQKLKAQGLYPSGSGRKHKIEDVTVQSRAKCLHFLSLFLKFYLAEIFGRLARK